MNDINRRTEEFLDYVSNLSDDEIKSLQYDLLIMDEGQDILRPVYQYSLDVLLKNGLENGDWTIFCDEKQNIYNPEYADGIDIVTSYSNTKFKLYVNECTAPKQVGLR